MRSVEEIVAIASEAGASDIHLACNIPPKMRLHGSWKILMMSL